MAFGIQAKGPAEGWFDWIKRKQQEMKGERFKVLCQLAAVYRDRLNEPEKAATTLRESLADMPFYTMPLEKLIADQWPAKKSDAVLGAELGRRRPAATDLVKLLEQRGQFDAAIDIQSRVVLASYWPGGLPYRRHREALGTAERTSRQLAAAPCRLDQSAEPGPAVD